MFDAFLGSIFEPLLSSVGVLGFVAIISLVVTAISTVIYKYTTDQILMKQLREDLKKMQEESKVHRKDPKKLMFIQGQMMEKQGKMMKHTFSATLWTILPVIILIGWLSSHLAYLPLNEDTQFTVSISFDDYKGNVTLVVPKGMTIIDSSTKDIASTVDWRLSGKNGDYLLEFNVGDKKYNKEVLITSEPKYTPAITKVDDGIVKVITINYKKQIVLNLFGWQLGWFGSYFVFAIIFSMILRKLLKVY